MPELPEVETTLRGIEPHIIRQTVSDVTIRHPRLRWPIPKNLKTTLQGHPVRQLIRRAKYLLFVFDHGTLILHLGMSGRLRVLKAPIPPDKHDHVDIMFANKKYLRYTDPRRFGALLWTNQDPLTHSLLKNIGPEPLDDTFNSNYLLQQAHNKKVPIKTFIMNSNIVAGVGNIYATEALFQAHIHPLSPANKIGSEQWKKLARAIKNILNKAIKKGGTTLKDFTQSDGSPGYFKFALKVYGRAGKPCQCCRAPLKSIQIAQRSTVYCEYCQQ